MVVLEHCSNGNLKSFLTIHKHEAQQMRDNGTLLQMILDMANGVHYLNTMEVAHKYICVCARQERERDGGIGDGKMKRVK